MLGVIVDVASSVARDRLFLKPPLVGRTGIVLGQLRESFSLKNCRTTGKNCVRAKLFLDP